MDPHSVDNTPALQDDRSAPTPGAVLPRVAQCIADVLGIDAGQLQPSSVLLDLGAQSFDFVDLVFQLERAFGVNMPRAYLVPDAHTVGAFADAVIAALAAGRENVG
jgi:acyl carrier protein